MHIELCQPKGTKDIVVRRFDGVDFEQLGSFPSPIKARALAEKTRRKTGLPVFNYVQDASYVGPMKSMRFGP